MFVRRNSVDIANDDDRCQHHIRACVVVVAALVNVVCVCAQKPVWSLHLHSNRLLNDCNCTRGAPHSNDVFNVLYFVCGGDDRVDFLTR